MIIFLKLQWLYVVIVCKNMKLFISDFAWISFIILFTSCLIQDITGSGSGSNLWTNLWVWARICEPTSCRCTLLLTYGGSLCVSDFFFFFLFYDKNFRYCFASKVDWSSLCHTFEFSSWSRLLSPVEDFRSILISIGSVHIRTQVTVPTRLLSVLLIRLLKSLIWFESFSHVKAGNLVTKI